MSIPIELVVSLKIPDVTALTARRALQRRLGYGDVLADLSRADWWRVELSAADDDTALALGRELAEQTNLFVNPNKHVYTCVRQALPPAPRDGVTAVSVLTGFKDDASAAMVGQALRGRLGYGDRVGEVDKGTLWTFFLREGDPARARELAEAMTVSQSQDQGLLVNPHSMWWRPVG